MNHPQKNKPSKGITQLCALCLKERGSERHHIIPISVDGPNELWNIIVLCPTCHGIDVHYNWVEWVGRLVSAANRSDIERSEQRKRLVEKYILMIKNDCPERMKPRRFNKTIKRPANPIILEALKIFNANELSKKLGVFYTTIARWKAGRIPAPLYLKKIERIVRRHREQAIKISNGG